MFRLKPFLVASLLLVIAAVVLAACGGDSAPVPAPTPSPFPPTPTPVLPTPTQVGSTNNSLTGPLANILTKAASALIDVRSYHGTITTEASGSTVESAFDYQAPDRLHMSYTYTGGTVDIIVIGRYAYAKAPGATGYTAIPSGGYNVGGLNPAQIAIMLNAAQTGQIVGDEQVQGADTTHIRFTFDTNRVIREMAQQAGQPIPTPLADLGTSTVDAWVEKSTDYIVQYKSSVTGGGAGTLTSTMTLSKFNEPINPPIVAPTLAP